MTGISFFFKGSTAYVQSKIFNSTIFQVHELRRLQEEVRHQLFHRQVRWEEAQLQQKALIELRLRKRNQELKDLFFLKAVFEN